MAAYGRDDRGAFRLFFAVYGPKVHGFFFNSFRDRSVAEELTQATFLRVHKARATYRDDLAVTPWLFTIAANIRRDELRRRLRSKEVLDEAALDDAMEALAAVAPEPPRTDVTDRVRAAVDALPETQRVVVHLHRFEGLPMAEIAGILGLSEIAVRVRASRGYEQLRTTLRSVVQEEGLR